MRLLSALLALLLTLPLLIAPHVLAAPRPHLRSIPHVAFHRVCASTVPGHAACLADLVSQQPAYNGGLTPAALHQAYNLPTTTPVAQTIAIVDAGGDATIASDLASFDAGFGLPPCTTSNGCLTVVNGQGQASPLPPSQGWEVEIALDVETAHAICQNCRILLVEGADATFSSLATAENTAVRLGATEISNSYGGAEGFNAGALASAYNHPGVAITASSGDAGYGTNVPASLPSVIAVGGTTLSLYTDGSYAGESTWYTKPGEGAGSGCSSVFSAPAWQRALPNWASVGCGHNRAVADVSADADPATGAIIYSQGWHQVGGTSLASPLIAATIALAGGMAGVALPNSVPYINARAFHDVTTGSNGYCGNAAICTAGSGYDGPTGLGTPNGPSGFAARSTPPTPPAPPAPPFVPHCSLWDTTFYPGTVRVGGKMRHTRYQLCLWWHSHAA